MIARSPLTLAAFAALAALTCAAWWSVPARAHVTVASQYTFKRDVLPILEARCGRCHADGGIAETLLKYASAKSQAWPIRQALMSGRMPPWPGDAAPVPFKGAQTLSAREFNTLMVWSAGGTPEGTAPPRTVARPREWPLGIPDAVIPMTAPFTLDAGVERADHELTLPPDAVRGKWIRAVDLSPGVASIVRRAEVVLKTAGSEQTIGVWLPGDTPALLEGGAAFQVTDGASISLRLHYRRAHSSPARALTDRSRLGIYFAAPQSRAQVRTLELIGDGEFPFGSDRVVTLAIDQSLRLIAIRPVTGPADATLRLSIVGPDGHRSPLATLVLRKDWPRRYVLAAPILLAPGSRLEARVTPSRGFLWQGLTGDLPAGPADGGPLRLAFEVLD